MAFSTASLRLLQYIPRDVEALLKAQNKTWQATIDRAPLGFRATAKEREAAEAALLKELSALRVQHIATLDALRPEVRKRQAEVGLDVEVAMGYPATNDKTELLLRATEKRAAWDRMVRLLDQEKGQRLTNAVLAFASQALARGDENTLQALLSELPTYQQARTLDGSNQSGVMEAASQSPLAAVMQAIGDARPDAKDAMDALAFLPKGVANVTSTIDHAVAVYQHMAAKTWIVEYDGSQRGVSMDGLETVPLPKMSGARAPLNIALERRMRVG